MDESSSRHSGDATKASISFWELHNSYGRPILSDLNAWKHEQRKQLEKMTNVDNLISL